jgi:hypothetical protein
MVTLGGKPERSGLRPSLIVELEIGRCGAFRLGADRLGVV